MTSVTCTRDIGAYIRGVPEIDMTKSAAPTAKPARPVSTWKRDLIASIVLASGMLISTCAFAGVWAATHPELFNA